MALVLIDGAHASGKTYIANALRNCAVSFGKGALLLDERTIGEPKELIEKLIDTVEFNPALGTAQPWKKDPQVVAVGPGGKAKLDELEQFLPGFTSLFGVVYRVTTAV